MFSGREGGSLLVALLSLAIASYSLWLSKVSVETTLRAEQSAQEKELRKKALILTAKPAEGGKELKLSAANKDTVFQLIKIKLEYADHVSEFDMSPGADELTMEYIRPYINRRIKHLKSTKTYKDSREVLVDEGLSRFDGYLPILVYAEYAVDGELLEDLSLYRVTFTASWKKDETNEDVQFTGIAFCARVPIAEKESWLADDHVFAGIEVPGTIAAGPSPKAVRFVNCSPGPRK